MTSLPQLPPRGVGASAIDSSDPPVASMRRNFPSAKNASDLLSGDQNGKSALSVPLSGCAKELSGRTQSRGAAAPDFATNAILLPSGDKIAVPPSNSKTECGGALMWVYVSRGGVTCFETT